MTDVAGQIFPDLTRDQVLAPLGMTRSTYANPLAPEQLAHAAAGVRPDGSDVPGKRHTSPEMAAAGLWTTAEDPGLPSWVIHTTSLDEAVKGAASTA